jgi:uncharacterized protein (TIGR03086 family)
MDTLVLLKQATDGFIRRLERVKPKQWHDDTPCTDWDVRQLVNHVTGELLWIPDLVAGKTIAEVGTKFDGDVLGKDPLATFQQAADDVAESLSSEGALSRTVHLSFGDYSADNYARQIASDVAIHTWDLARAIDADEELDPKLVALAEEVFGPMFEGGRETGSFGPEVAASSDADAQTKLLAKTGRQP